ncbi:MAG TPA: retropepsin-like aspartic protease [Hydrogenophaga sp.]
MHHSLLTLCACLCVSSGAWSQSVALSGVSGNKALLTVDSGAPRFISPGQSHDGVRLLEVNGQSATVEIAGQKQTLQVGEAPVRLGGAGQAPGSGRRIVLTADRQGHFMPQGQINGRSVQFMVDTGATVVAIGEPEAKRINLKYLEGRRVLLNTANGSAIGYEVKLDSLRLGDVMSYNITAVVTPQPMPYVLLGNSYLTRFQMNRTNDQLALEKRY